MAIYLMTIGAMTGKTFSQIEREFDGKGYGDFKLAVGESVCDKLKPIQKIYYINMIVKIFAV